MTGEEFLRHAAGVVRKRHRDHGEPAATFELIAARWSQVLGTEVTAAQVAMCMIDLKLVRLIHDPAHLDSLVDVAGYAACLSEVSR